MSIYKKHWRLALVVMIVGLLAFGTAMTVFGNSCNGPLVDPTPFYGPGQSGNPDFYDVLGVDELEEGFYEARVEFGSGSFHEGFVIIGGHKIFYEVSDPYVKFWTEDDAAVIYAVIVKGGRNANLYDYADVYEGDRNGGTTLGYPVNADCNLQSPLQGNNVPGVSHIDFLVGPLPTGCLEVEKVWAGPYDAAELPDYVTVKVYNDAAKTDDDLVDTLTLNDANDWTDKVCDLPTGTYWVEEIDAPADFTTSYSATYIAVVADETAEITITNTYIPPKGQTAWAAHEPGVYRYNPDGGNWFTYVKYSELAVIDGVKTAYIYAGQTNYAGYVTFTDERECTTLGYWVVDITINLDGWAFDQGTNVYVQDYENAPIGQSTASGQFDYNAAASSSPYTITVPLNNYYGIHVNVYELP